MHFFFLFLNHVFFHVFSLTRQNVFLIIPDASVFQNFPEIISKTIENPFQELEEVDVTKLN